MGTTAEKLQAIVSAKADIGAAITEKGGTVPQKLSEYGAAIRALPSGNLDVSVAPLDPAAVREATRPADWLPMPEAEEGDIYILLDPTLIPQPSDIDPLNSTIEFVIEAEDNPVLVEGFGHKYSNDLSVYPDAEPIPSDYTFIVTDGIGTHFSPLSFLVNVCQPEMDQQYLVHVRCPNIIRIATMSKDGYNQIIAEISANLPKCYDFKLGPSSTQSYSLYPNLRYFKFIGSGGDNKDLLYVGFMFQNCTSLIAIESLPGLEDVLTIESTFSGCTNLVAVPPIYAPKATSLASAFKDCRSIKRLPYIYAPNAVNFTSFARDCISLEFWPEIPLKLGIGSGANAYRSCVKIKEIRNAILPAVASSFLPRPFGDETNSDFQIEYITLNPFYEPDFRSVPINYPKLNHTALVSFLMSLPTLPEGETGTVTFGELVTSKAELTESEIKIATDKGWSVAR